jgi:hypothetical protein
MTVKDDLHNLVDKLDEDATWEALAYLRAFSLPPFLRNAPIDDEPETDQERTAVAEAETAIASGDIVRDEDLERELRRDGQSSGRGLHFVICDDWTNR